MYYVFVMYDKSTFANSLKSLLEKRGMTQRSLAEKLKTTEATVSRYTSGHRTPTQMVVCDTDKIK